MPSERQVAVWIGECLKQNLRPDALWIESVQNVVRVVTRKPGTRDERGPTYVVVVRQEEPVFCEKCGMSRSAECSDLGH